MNSLQHKLSTHLQALAVEIGERNIFHPDKLKATSSYIRQFWEAQSFKVQEQAYQVDGIPCENLSVEIKGKEFADGIVLVGAHYDSVLGSPGANDNASGVAAMLEISAALRGQEFPRALRFVAFTNEEPPFFESDKRGSLVYAQECSRRKEKIAAMLCLETIGFYTDRPGSQQYPPLFDLFYPEQGNFLALVGDLNSGRLVNQIKRIFREAGNFPIESVCAPRFVPGVDWSDHASFWDEGYPAVMFTDTAPYRYPHYHLSTDTPDKLNLPAFAEVVEILTRLVAHLSSEPSQ